MTEITRKEIECLRDDLAGALTIRASLVRPLVEHALSEQSRIDAAVAKERERCAAIALSIAVRDGLSAGRARERRHARDEALFESGASVASEIHDRIRTPTPTTEEGA